MVSIIDGKDHDPPILPFQRNYCYFINAANDHYSADGIPLSDRNPLHLSLHDSYKWEFDFNDIHAPRWLMENASGYETNIHPEQLYSGAPHMSNISVIDWPHTSALGYANASYLMFNSDQIESNNGVQNQFFLLVDQPLHAFSPPTYFGQTQAQQFYHEVAGTVDYTTLRRWPWSTSSSILSFMALWSQLNPTTGRMEMKYGNYYFTPE